MTARRVRLLLGLAILGCGFGAATTAPAHADTSGFLAALASNGISYRDAPGMIKDGTLVCAELRDRQDVGEIIVQAEQEGGFTRDEAPIIIMAAVDELCPDTLPYLQQQASAAQRPKLNYVI